MQQIQQMQFAQFRVCMQQRFALFVWLSFYVECFTRWLTDWLAYWLIDLLKEFELIACEQWKCLTCLCTPWHSRPVFYVHWRHLNYFLFFVRSGVAIFVFVSRDWKYIKCFVWIGVELIFFVITEISWPFSYRALDSLFIRIITQIYAIVFPASVNIPVD